MDTSKDGKRYYSCRSALSKKLVPFLNREELTDIHVKVGQRTFAAHRLVLGSWSDKLANLMMTASDNVMELTQNATDKEIEVFETVLNFLYTGEMSFSAGNVRMVMSLANRTGTQEVGRYGSGLGRRHDKPRKYGRCHYVVEGYRLNTTALP